MASKIYLPKGTNATPFNPQLQHFDFICGQIIHENRILKYVVVISCLAFFLSIGITVFAINRPDSVPVLVTMNDFGETHYIGEVGKKNWQGITVPEVAIAFQAKDFVSLYHSMSTDRAVLRRNMEKAYHLLTATSASKYSNLLKEDGFFDKFGSQTREVAFETEPIKLTKDTYQFDYKVITRSLSGQIERTDRYRVALVIKTLDPDKEDIQDNPLGIYITDFEIKELN